MRLAILGDIHGNLAAFEAVLADIEPRNVDDSLILGDVVGCGPDPAACWQLANSLGWPMLQGNHERYHYHYGTPTAPAEWDWPRFAPLRWSVGQMTPASLLEMAALPSTLRLPSAPGVLFVHASARSDADTITALTPPDRLADMFAWVEERLIIRGHNHLPQVRLWYTDPPTQIVTTGSVGLPLNASPTAQYLILEKRRGGWQIHHQQVAYDLAATERRYRESGLLSAGGVMAQLYLKELQTATNYVVPFLQAYYRWGGEPLSLRAAWVRFCGLG